MERRFDLQGHRGARGLRPENTLPAIETALDLLVTTLEVDLHRTKDGVPVLFHDEALHERLARVEGAADVPEPKNRPRLCALTLAEIRRYIVDGNGDVQRFPEQRREPTPLAQAFAGERKLSPYVIPTLAELLDFTVAYAGKPGERIGKSAAQRERASQIRFNLELKRVPFRPEFMGDRFDGREAAELEHSVVNCLREKNLVERCVIQSFDHRAVKAARTLEPRLTGAVLIANTAPAQPAALSQAAGASIYSPDFQFIDAEVVRCVQAAGLRIIPWTVNEIADMERLLDWGVDGLITDYPNRIIPLLQMRHMRF